MKKVIFKVEDYEEEQEYPNNITTEQIEEDFEEWLAGRSEWWVEE